MSLIDTRPRTIDILHLAGDTLTLEIRGPASLFDGMLVEAHVRKQRSDTVFDASFEITQSERGAVAVLSSAETRRLCESGELVGGTMVYTGYWDAQVSSSGSDPVTSLGMGMIRIEQDTTRAD